MPWKKDNPKLIEYKKKHNKMYREKNRQYFRDAYSAWAKNNPDKLIERQRKYRSSGDNLVRVRARQAVYRAIREGKMTRPDSCSQCAVVGKIEADHSDYSRPLDVRWLCKPCHTTITVERRSIIANE